MRTVLLSMWLAAAAGHLTPALAAGPSGARREVSSDSAAAETASTQLRGQDAETSEDPAPLGVIPPHAAGYVSYGTASVRPYHSVYHHFCCATFNSRWVFDYPWHRPAYGPMASTPYQVGKRIGPTQASSPPIAPMPPKLQAAVAGDRSTRNARVRSSPPAAKTR